MSEVRSAILQHLRGTNSMQGSFLDNCLACIARMQKNDNFTALQSMQGILHITALQPCEFLPLLKTFFHFCMGPQKHCKKCLVFGYQIPFSEP